MGYYGSDNSEGSEHKEGEKGYEKKDKGLDSASLVSIHKDNWIPSPEIQKSQVSDLSSSFDSASRSLYIAKGPINLFSF